MSEITQPNILSGAGFRPVQNHIPNPGMEIILERATPLTRYVLLDTSCAGERPPQDAIVVDAHDYPRYLSAFRYQSYHPDRIAGEIVLHCVRDLNGNRTSKNVLIDAVNLMDNVANMPLQELMGYLFTRIYQYNSGIYLSQNANKQGSIVLPNTRVASGATTFWTLLRRTAGVTVPGINEIGNLVKTQDEFMCGYSCNTPLAPAVVMKLCELGVLGSGNIGREFTKLFNGYMHSGQIESDSTRVSNAEEFLFDGIAMLTDVRFAQYIPDAMREMYYAMMQKYLVDYALLSSVKGWEQNTEVKISSIFPIGATDMQTDIRFIPYLIEGFAYIMHPYTLHRIAKTKQRNIGINQIARLSNAFQQFINGVYQRYEQAKYVCPTELSSTLGRHHHLLKNTLDLFELDQCIEILQCGAHASSGAYIKTLGEMRDHRRQSGGYGAHTRVRNGDRPTNLAIHRK